MLYAIVSANTIIQYPAYPDVENQNTSFPYDWMGGVVNGTEYVVVATTAAPSINAISESLSEGSPTYNAGSSQWEQTWNVVTANAAVIAERTAQFEASATATANALLQQSDTYVVQAIETGVGLSTEFVTYRSDLAQPNTLPGYPLTTSFPSLPNTIFDNTAPLPGNYVVKSGDTMTGELNMGFYNIVGLADPSNPQDAAHKQYVDNTVSSAIANVSGGSTNTDASYTWTNTHTFNNIITLNNILNTNSNVNITDGSIISITNANTGIYADLSPTELSIYNDNSSDVTSIRTGNAEFYDASGNSTKIDIGSISIYSDKATSTPALPTQSYHVATKQYVDNSVSGLGVNTTAQYTWTNTHTFNSTVALNAVSANGSTGTAYQVLTSNGSDSYWGSINGLSYTGTGVGAWTGSHQFSASVSFTNTVAISGTLTLNAVQANNSLGTDGQVLTSNGSDTYWSTITGGGSVNTAASYTWTNTQNFNWPVYFNGNPINFGTSTNITIGNNYGSAGQVLTSNGTSGVYWSTVSGGGSVNTAASYTWTNSHTFNWPVTINGNPFTLGSSTTLSANGSAGSSGQVLTSSGSGVYWSTPSGGGSVNTAASYTWTNTHTFNWPVNFNGNPITIGSSSSVSANGSAGSAGQVLTTSGSSVYWSTPSSGTPSWTLMGQLSSSNTMNFPGGVTFSTFASTYKEIIMVIYNSGGTHVTSVLPLATVAAYPVIHTVYGNVSGAFGVIGNYTISGSSATGITVTLETNAPGPWSTRIFYR